MILEYSPRPLRMAGFTRSPTLPQMSPVFSQPTWWKLASICIYLIKSTTSFPKKVVSCFNSQPGNHSIFVEQYRDRSWRKSIPSFRVRWEYLFPILKELGHEITPVQPALAPLIVSQKAIAPIQGVRMDAGIRLFANGKLLDETLGNIIFTKGGINGPGVMDISYLVNATQEQEPGS